MKVFISPKTFDLSGPVEIDVRGGDGGGGGPVTRRVSSVATLDGGVALSDRGFSDGDRELTYSWRAISRAHNESVARLIELYPLVVVSTIDGVFEAAPTAFDGGLGVVTFNLTVKRKLG